MARLRPELPRLLAAEPEAWRVLGTRPALVALCHWNANVDNAWFWRDAGGTSTRMDPGIADVESVRCRLQMLVNVLNLCESSDDGPLALV